MYDSFREWWISKNWEQKEADGLVDEFETDNLHEIAHKEDFQNEKHLWSG